MEAVPLYKKCQIPEPEEPRGNEERHAASQKAAWASVGGWTNVYKSYAERYLNRVDELLLRGA